MCEASEGRRARSWLNCTENEFDGGRNKVISATEGTGEQLNKLQQKPEWDIKGRAQLDCSSSVILATLLPANLPLIKLFFNMLARYRVCQVSCQMSNNVICVANVIQTLMIDAKGHRKMEKMFRRSF